MPEERSLDADQPLLYGLDRCHHLFQHAVQPPGHGLRERGIRGRARSSALVHPGDGGVPRDGSLRGWGRGEEEVRPDEDDQHQADGQNEADFSIH